MAKRGPKPKGVSRRGRKRGTQFFVSDPLDARLVEIAEAYMNEQGLSVRRASRLAAQHQITETAALAHAYGHLHFATNGVTPRIVPNRALRALAGMADKVRVTRTYEKTGRNILDEAHPKLSAGLPETTASWVDPNDTVAQRIAQRIYRKRRVKR